MLTSLLAHDEKQVPASETVLIVGSGRNGSSLLLRLLDGSAGLAVYPNDFNYFRTFNRHTWKGRLRDFLLRLLLGQYANSLLEHYHFRRWAHSEWIKLYQEIPSTRSLKDEHCIVVDNSVVEAIRCGFASGSTQFSRAVCERFADSGIDAKLVLKTTECDRIYDYMTLFSIRRCVHIFRDPVRTYASLKRTHHFKSQPPWYDGGDILREIVDRRWNAHVNAYRELVARNPDSHIVVRYEDLISSPQQEIARVCNFLGVAMPEQPTKQTIFGGHEMRHGSSNPSQLGLSTPQVVSANLEAGGGYLAVIEPREEQLIRVLTQTNAHFLGYPAPSDSVSLESLRSAWRFPDKWEIAFWYRPWRMLRFLVARRLWIRRRLRMR